MCEASFHTPYGTIYLYLGKANETNSPLFKHLFLR